MLFPVAVSADGRDHDAWNIVERAVQRNVRLGYYQVLGEDRDLLRNIAGGRGKLRTDGRFIHEQVAIAAPFHRNAFRLVSLPSVASASPSAAWAGNVVVQSAADSRQQTNVPAALMVEPDRARIA